jgi:hypothetical protein
MEKTTNEQVTPVHTITSENENMTIIVRFKNEDFAMALGEEIAKRGIQPIDGEYKMEASSLLDMLKK